MKRSFGAACSSEMDSSDSDVVLKKRRVELKTFYRWQRDLDKDYQTISWLECTTTDYKKVVDKLKCKVCARFMDRIRGMRNMGLGL